MAAPSGRDRLRLLAFCDYFSPSSCGGAERVAMQVYRRLAASDVDVTLVTVVPGEPERAYDVSGIRVVSLTALDLSRVVRAQAMLPRRMLGRVFREADAMRPDVLHVNSLHFQTSLAGAVLGRSRRVPLVLTAHIGELDFLPLAMRIPTAIYERTAGRFVLRSSERVIAVSPSVAEHLASLGVAQDRIDVVANGVDHDVFYPVDKPPSPFPLVTFVGRLMPNKGPHLLVEAMSELRDSGLTVRAEFLGDGPLRGSLEQAVRDRGLSPWVSFAGAVQNVADRLRHADVMVRPSLTEGMPLAVLEAMASGVCVVASDVPGNAALVRDGENGRLFPPGDARALAMVLRWALENPHARKRLALAGRARALDYSWDTAAAQTRRVLLRAAAERAER